MDRIADLNQTRRVHRADLASFGFAETYAFWCEWAHPQVPDDRELTHLIDVHARIWNWEKFIPTGATCIDIGAHSGDTTIPMAICAYGGPEQRGTVLAIEPNIKVLPVLELNLLLNANLAELHLVNKAVTREPVAEVEIIDHGNWNCNGGIIDASYSSELQQHLRHIAGSTITAQGAPLGAICDEALSPDQLARLAFIKTDCEGYDKEILRSAFDVIDRYKPTLFIEWFNCFSEADSHDLFEAIREIGYVAYHPMTGERQPLEHKIDDLILLPRGVDATDRFRL